MTHAEALYAYNQWVAMNDWVDGLDMALTTGAVTFEEVPALLECHAKALELAYEATGKFHRTDLAKGLREYRVKLRDAIADIVRLNKEYKDTQSQ